MQKLRFAVLILALCQPFVAARADAQSMTRLFHADMSAADETKYTESEATGTADFTLDLDTKRITWVVAYDRLSGPPLSVAIYGPAQPGANGQMMFSLADKSLASPITGSQPVTEAQIQYLLYGWTYVNVVTAKFEKGEIRGQLDIKQKPAEPPAAPQH